MYTIIETELFSRKSRGVWTEEERGAFGAYLAVNPEAGDVVKGSGGCRKVRWSRAGSGKSSGVRVIYFNRIGSGEIWLLTLYTKANTASIPAHILKAIKEEIEND
ncbi:MAG: transcriptional regulator [Zoogloeaceae bacterium]|jgi:hypothetical protein|nr:transcriptional regulator [Zoogloeaceae bacterium]